MALASILNPYTYIGAAAVVAAVGGGFYYQGTQIHKYHVLANQEHDANVVFKERIKTLTSNQNTQTAKTEENIKVISAPPQIVKVLTENKNQPLPADCKTPDIPEELVPYL